MSASIYIELRDDFMRNARHAKERHRADAKIRLVRQARILNWCALDEAHATTSDYAELRRRGLLPEEEDE